MTSVPRSLFFLPNLNGGGAQRTAINLVHHWPDDRPRPTLAVASASGAGRLWLTGIDPVDLGSGRLRWSLLPLRRLIRRQRPDIVFSTMVGANIVAAASMIGLRSPPPILVVRETSHRARSTLSFAQRAAIGQAYRRAVVVVALSEGVRMELLEYYRLKPERVVMIHNPVDVDAFHSRASGRAHPWQGNGRWWSQPGAWCVRRGSTSCFVPSPTCLRPIHALPFLARAGPRGVGDACRRIGPDEQDSHARACRRSRAMVRSCGRVRTIVAVGGVRSRPRRSDGMWRARGRLRLPPRSSRYHRGRPYWIACAAAGCPRLGRIPVSVDRKPGIRRTPARRRPTGREAVFGAGDRPDLCDLVR